MTDHFERLQAIKERVDKLLAKQTAVDKKLDHEIQAMEIELALAAALGALKAAARDCRHERVRAQVNGARDQITKVLSAA